VICDATGRSRRAICKTACFNLPTNADYLCKVL
jgi:hypothetical protein